MEDYDDAEMPGSRLNIGLFYGNRGTSEQISIIPFRVETMLSILSLGV